MKIIFTFLFLICCAGTKANSNGRVDFNIRFSELYATYDFLIKISDNYPDNDLKIRYLKSEYNTEVNRQAIKLFEQLPLDYAYSFQQFPKPMKAGLMSRDVLERNLVLSPSIEAFMDRSTGMLPATDLILLSQVLRQFMPVYHSLVLTPYKDQFATQEQAMKAYADNGMLSGFFAAGLTFYNTQWDTAVPFEICMLPAMELDHMNARAFFNVAVCEPPLGLKDHKTLFSVAIHEIYHIIYDNQSLEMKYNIKSWFEATHSPNRQYALLLLNEVLATALGNGYVMESLNGKIEEEDWYANKYISTMAKEIYPVVKEYISKQKPVDELFIRNYVHIYDSLFPHWNKELDHLMMYRYIVADDQQDLNYINKTYRYYSYRRSGIPFSVGEIDRAAQEPITKVIIVSRNHKAALTAIKMQYPPLQRRSFNDKKEFAEVITLADQTKLIIINRHGSTTEVLMKRWFPCNILP